ncbi:MAG: hypothetical protein POELPBGB_02058 [Bacteroidia bacterium]|nr:hypothetical protein [Bacteroidia bacterium]
MAISITNFQKPSTMNFQNPYNTLGPQLKTALDYIIANLPLSPTFENLNNTLFDALFGNNPPSDSLAIVYAKSVLPNVYNGYTAEAATLSVVEGHLNKYPDKQYKIIYYLLREISTTPTEAIPQLLNATDEKIATSGLTFAEQTPLFVATALGKAVYEYWLLHIPQPSAWAAYMVNPGITPQAMDALNYNNVNSWVSAAMEGALSGWGSINLPKIDFVDMTAANIAGIGMAAGKVVFKW